MGVPAGSLMPKSVSFLWKGKNSIVGGVMLAYLFWWDCLIFIVDDHDDFPYWMMIRRPPHWVGDLFFLIANRIFRG